MTNLPSPCKGCVDRKLACHDTCPRYGMFKAAIQLEREAERKAKTLDDYGRSLVVKKPRR